MNSNNNEELPVMISSNRKPIATIENSATLPKGSTTYVERVATDADLGASTGLERIAEAGQSTQNPREDGTFKTAKVTEVSVKMVDAGTSTATKPSSNMDQNTSINTPPHLLNQRKGNSSNPNIETLNRIRQTLQNYAPNDELDQDNIEDIIVKMNKAAFQRHRQRKILNLNRPMGSIPNEGSDPDLDTLEEGDEACWTDRDLFQNHTNSKQNYDFLHALINVVDADFFYEIIDSVEASTHDFLLNEDTVKMVRQSLAIRDDGKKRKRRDLRLKINSTGSFNSFRDNTASGSTDSSLSSSMHGMDGLGKNKEEHSRRLTRGVVRNIKRKFIHDNKSVEQEGLEALLLAVAELEKAEGRSMNLLEDLNQTRRLRKRHKVKNQKLAIVENSNDSEGKDDGMVKLFDANGTEVTKITVGGKIMSSPKKRGPKRKKRSNDEDDNGGIAKSKGGDVPFSLSLLDWSNRLPLKVKNQNMKRALPTKSRKKEEFVFTEEIIDSTIASWEALDNANGLSDKLATMEPLRQHHSNKTYGQWCSDLVKCLQGSARVFARYEFFYSDIDRAWFNENTFHKDLKDVGIDIDSKLSRPEWNAIRRKIQKKPRRFSRAFIDKEFEKLNKYRQEVRRIQKQVHMGSMPYEKTSDFEYEVLAPAKIGTIASAYHHKAHLIHRGTVLCHDYETEAYLIQFEKKSLGYEWCADFEVASHGLPEKIFPSANDLPKQHCSQLQPNLYGTLTTGTDYGPLLEFYNKERQGGSAPIDVSTENLSHFKADSGEIVKKIAEREALVKLMCQIELMLERKDVLLETIIVCTESFKQALKNGDIMPPQKSRNKQGANTLDTLEAKKENTFYQFQEHLKWLQSNISSNEKALETALTQLQIIYGAGYTGLANSPIEENLMQRDHQKGVSAMGHGDASYLRYFEDALDRLVFDIGEGIAKKVMSPTESSTEPELDSLTDQYMSSLLASSGSLLLASDLALEMLKSKTEKNDQKMAPASIPLYDESTVRTVLSNQVEQLRPEALKSIPGQTGHLQRSREIAFNNLVTSIQMLEAELTTSWDIKP